MSPQVVGEEWNESAELMNPPAEADVLESTHSKECVGGKQLAFWHF